MHCTGDKVRRHKLNDPAGLEGSVITAMIFGWDLLSTVTASTWYTSPDNMLHNMMHGEIQDSIY